MLVMLFFFFKQKTAYEMRISDWSSDVCSSDLGCSMDWANERFTMDEGFSKAVIKVFVELHRRGLLYRDKRLVNWDPRFRSAISDLEVETQEVKGGFWHFRYPLADGVRLADGARSEEHTSELQSLMRISYAVFCLKK